MNGLANAGDLMTKNVPFEVIKKHLAAINCEWRDGRAQVSAQLHRVGAREQQKPPTDEKTFAPPSGMGSVVRGQPPRVRRGHPPGNGSEEMQDDRIVIATRNTEGKVRHFISLPKSMKDTWPEVQWRRTSDRDSGEMLCDEMVGGVNNAVMYRRLDKPRRLTVEFMSESCHDPEGRSPQ